MPLYVQGGVKPDALDSLTALRFFAALIVLVHHYGTFRAKDLPTLPDQIINLLNKGHMGVSAFFVLSGFILAYRYGSAARLRPADFWVARFARIYPAYLFGLALSAGAALLAAYRSYIINGWDSVLALAANLLMVQSWFESTAATWNVVNWTLSVEAFFYLVFPLVLYALRGASERRLFAVAVVCTLAAAALDNLWLTGLRGTGPWAFYSSTMFPPARLFDFVLGCVAGMAFLRRDARDPLWRVAAAVLSLQLVIVLVSPIVLPYGQRLFLPLIAAALFALAAADRSGWKVPGVLIYGGEISYAVYIVHMPILLVMHDRLGHMHGTKLFALYLATSLVVSAACYHFVEKPLRGWIARRYAARMAHSARREEVPQGALS